MFHSLDWRSTHWITEIVNIDTICDASGSIKEGVHERLEREIFCVGNLEGRQLVFFDVLAVHSDQRQSNVSTTVSR